MGNKGTILSNADAQGHRIRIEETDEAGLTVGQVYDFTTDASTGSLFDLALAEFVVNSVNEIVVRDTIWRARGELEWSETYNEYVVRVTYDNDSGADCGATYRGSEMVDDVAQWKALDIDDTGTRYRFSFNAAHGSVDYASFDVNDPDPNNPPFGSHSACP